ncbi:PhzF family phenazine biosynthesis protein [Actinoplanes sp. NBRC 103695]|uniref:PhzF family phenazine biosynthesis protein n=1 Tax=Actinoplanes sp. NBRC 103695 TaxID=3032202 RepID=UPI0024A535E8|nr:PhzF family phenazine biosynthesis protein [Actinoplanes sp. NBRC 103695]GLZ02070.1 trans-2,3-dihydro-3-hydroxyanthranilate isomerase [Actinoplanes sp. NBRC 103695]
MTRYEYSLADVFTTTSLAGNPVAVFDVAAAVPEALMQPIARELNLSETVFVLPGDGSADVRVRIFTPVNELPFAGHPTMGTAIVLGSARPGHTMTMGTGRGVVPFTFDRDSDGRILSATMRQPVPTWQPYEHTEVLLRSLGAIEPVTAVDAYRNGPRHVLVGFGSVEELSAVRPDLQVIATLPDMSAICFAGSGSRWRMRMFSPAYGVTEDAGTGSAAGPLAIHLIRHSLVSPDDWIEIRQGVEMGRPSTMWASASGSGDSFHTVRLRGSAVVVGRGELNV